MTTAGPGEPSEECPVCEKESGIDLGFDVLGKDDLLCASCGTALEVEYEESWDGEDEHCYFWLVPRG